MRIFEIVTEPVDDNNKESYHRALLDKEQKFFKKVADAILHLVEDAVEIWLHGSRATGEFRRNSDWDFVVFLPELSSDRNIELHTIGGGSLGDLSIIAGRRVDVQAEDIHSNDYFTRIVRDEGVRIWKK